MKILLLVFSILLSYVNGKSIPNYNVFSFPRDILPKLGKLNPFHPFDPVNSMHVDKVEDRSPVILIPGLEGSQIEAKLNKIKVPSMICSKVSDWYQIWANPEEFLPEVIDCFIDNFRLEFNNKTKRTSSVPGVQTRVPGFGYTWSMELLTRHRFLDINGLNYYHNLVKTLKRVGYEVGKDLRGAPYDFRKAPNEQEDYFKALQTLIEDTYNKNGQRKVNIISHSMGCLYILYFFNHRDQGWKDKYIKQWIPVNGPYGGAGKAFAAVVLGNNLNVVFINRNSVKGMERSFPSSTFLLPTQQIFKNQNIIESHFLNLTTKDYPTIFRYIDYRNGEDMWRQTSNLTSEVLPPGVNVHCIYSQGEQTIEKLYYAKREDFPKNAEILYGDGDGTVNFISLEACRNWSSDKTHSFQYKIYQGIKHTDMVKHVDVIRNILGKINN